MLFLQDNTRSKIMPGNLNADFMKIKFKKVKSS